MFANIKNYQWKLTNCISVDYTICQEYFSSIDNCQIILYGELYISTKREVAVVNALK